MFKNKNKIKKESECVFFFCLLLYISVFVRWHVETIRHVAMNAVVCQNY